MKLSDYTSHDALGLAELVRRREVTPAELVDAATAALEQVNPILNAVIASLRDDAARTLEAGPPDGPFRGVPFLIKDLAITVAGVPTGMGSRLFQGLSAPHDSELMVRYRRAGLIALAKTNTPELGLSFTTEPAVHGPTRNPWQPERSPGGSSGGAAAAVAARVVPMAHANDAGGSIRVPASCCGLFGLKPSRGRMPTAVPEGDDLLGLAVEHAVTRSVRDSAALLDATLGPDPGAPQLPPPARPFLEEVRTPPERLRIAFMDEPWSGVKLSDECKAAARRAAELCHELGHEVVPARPEISWAELRATLHGLFLGYAAYSVDVIMPMLGLTPGPENLEAASLALAAAGRRRSANDLVHALFTREVILRKLGRFLSRFDILLTPAQAAPPVPLGQLAGTRVDLDGEAWMDLLFEFSPFTPLCNVTGNPAMSVPLYWTHDGLPIGAHFVGRHADEATLFRLAGQLEQAAPWAARRPGICAK